MTYNNVSTNGIPQSYMIADLATLQYLYGADFTTNSGDTVYSWSETTGETFINGVSKGATFHTYILMSIWDGGGNDTYDASNYGDGVEIDLRPGEFSTISVAQLGTPGALGNVGNAYLYYGDLRSLIENAIGGDGNDTLTGNEADNALDGHAGNDTLDGGGGNDSMSGGADNDIYVVDAAGDQTLESANAGTDTVRTTLTSYTLGSNVENLTFTDSGTHTGFGTELANVMTSGAGDDTFFGNAGNDTLNGGDGSDVLVAHTIANIFAQEHDILSGGDGNDTLYGEAADTLDGGAGFDVLQVINDFAVTLDLAAAGIEYVVSGFGNDTYAAAAATVTIEVYGGGGNDQITGGSGDDNLGLASATIRWSAMMGTISWSAISAPTACPAERQRPTVH